MEGTPPEALHLLRYAKTLGELKNHRLAALSFSAAASHKGTNPRVQARALYCAAQQLYFSLSSTTKPQHSHDEDSTRAVQFLRKCNILLRSQPHSAEMRMSVTALLENIYTVIADHHAAGKTIKAGLEDIASVVAMDRALVIHWWAYFQCRAIANALARREPAQTVVQMAEETALQCAKHGDIASAVAFCLTQSQIGLSNTTPDCVDISQTLLDARANLTELSHDPENHSDFVYLTFCYYILQGLEYMRRGDLRGAYAKVVKGLRKSYNRLRSLQQDGSMNGLWKWLPSQAMTAITCHIIIVTNPKEAEKRRETYALTSLIKLGIEGDSIRNFRPCSLKIADLPPKVSSTLAAVFFETAARIRLTSVDLESAALLITAAINAIFDDKESRTEVKRIEAGQAANRDKILPRKLPISQVMARCAVMLLAAEYYYLRGNIPAARVSQEFLQVALHPVNRFKNHEGNGFVSDGWQMAQSLYSLLTGQPRPGNLIQGIPGNQSLAETDKRNGLDIRFASNRVLGMAWFTIGVFQMRKNEVLESRKALQNSLSTLMDVAGENDQVVANATAVMSGLSLNHEIIGDIAPEMIKSAITMSEAMDDSVTMCRALRQYKKWVTRTTQDLEKKRAASNRTIQAYSELHEKQRVAGRHLFADPR